MFETATLSYGPPTKRVWTTAMGFTGQALLIGCAVLAPIISPPDFRARVSGHHFGHTRRSTAIADRSEDLAAPVPCHRNARLQDFAHRAVQDSDHSAQLWE
jgi:hypothetical protein